MPLYGTLGTPDEDKLQLTFPAGHSTSSWNNELVRESLNWLDRYFGEPRRADLELIVGKRTGHSAGLDISPRVSADP